MSDLNFVEFAMNIKSSWSSQLEINEVPQVTSYTTFLDGELAKDLPKHHQAQKFFKSDLESICKLLSIEFEIAAKLMALRNAWLGQYENCINQKIQNGEQNKIVGKDNEKAVADYLILKSSFWAEHNRVSEVVALLNEEQARIDSTIEAGRKQSFANSQNPEFIALLRKERERNFEDIEFCISEFDLEDNKFKSLEESDAWYAQLEINKAQRKISELKQEIEKLEVVMAQSERVIRRYKTANNEMNTYKAKGRPANSEFRVNVGKKFVSNWVISLMEILEVKSCQKLEQLISPYSTKLESDKNTGILQEITVSSKATERNWRRWLNGEATPNYNTFVILMSTKIEFGKFSGKYLQEIPTNPDSSQLQALLRFI